MNNNNHIIEDKWWYNNIINIKNILKIDREKYIYDLNTVDLKCKTIVTNLHNVKKYFYAMKANSNIEVLHCIYNYPIQTDNVCTGSNQQKPQPKRSELHGRKSASDGNSYKKCIYMIENDIFGFGKHVWMILEPISFKNHSKS